MSVDQKHLSTTVIHSLLVGSISSTLTTVVYQPLELLKTRIQLQQESSNLIANQKKQKLFGRTTKTAATLISEHSIEYLWRGTSASLLRSVPGVGLYYASLSALQINLSNQPNRPDDATQAFYFGITARSLVSFILLPVTVVKVRYESGRYNYLKLWPAIKESYLRSGWVGAAPTIIRDSLFSGVYYMCYIQLKSYSKESEATNHKRIFLQGIASGFVASVITNPVDVIKTKVQVVDSRVKRTLGNVIVTTLREKQGFVRLFDGLVPRCIRRTLIAATTWTMYEFMTNFLK